MKRGMAASQLMIGLVILVAFFLLLLAFLYNVVMPS